MKFELRPNNRGLSDAELLADLSEVARQLGKDYVTKDEYNACGRLSASAFQKRFGSWGAAHEKAGLRRIRNYQATAQDCIADLQRVARKLGSDTVTTAQYREHGRFCVPLISRRCGSWKAAMSTANLQVSPLYNEPHSEIELFQNLERMWEQLGRQPTQNDFRPPLTTISSHTYKRRFGSYRKALEAFVAHVSQPAAKMEEAQPNTKLAPVQSCESRKTNRNVGWQLRFLVMRHDNFKCRLCGASPAVQPGTLLEVDHIVPWASGGETEFDNLQTLCQVCNGGKSDLPLSTDG